MKRGTKRLALGIAFLVILAAAFLYFYFTHIYFQDRTEQSISEVFGTKADIEEAWFSLASCRGRMRELQIANPSDYDGRFLGVESLEFSIERDSLHSEPLHFPRISIEGVTLGYEQRGAESNLNTVLENISDYAASLPKDEQRQVRIDSLIITNCTGRAYFVDESGRRPVDFEFPDIEFTQLEGTVGEVIQQISKQAERHITGELGSTSVLFNRSKNAVGEAVESIGEGGRELFEGLKSLFSAPSSDSEPNSSKAAE